MHVISEFVAALSLIIFSLAPHVALIRWRYPAV
jgi:hypothetical protein